MNNILHIFGRDIKGLVRNFFALFIAGGLCLLPALYAWFNIYANWDPYGSTGNIQIAVANLDEGWTDDSGNTFRMGDDIVAQLKQKDSIGWRFVKTKERAVKGVESGEYYAALVIDGNFTYSMYHGVYENTESPKITYYVNDKKNAVATKITDTAVSTLQNSINQTFVQVAAQKVFTKANDISEDLSREDPVGDFVDKLTVVSDSLSDYDEMITSFMEANEFLTNAADEANQKVADGQKLIAEGKNQLEAGQNDLDETRDSFSDFDKSVASSMDAIERSLGAISEEIAGARFEEDEKLLKKDVNKISSDAADLSQKLGTLSDSLNALNVSTKLNSTIKLVDDMRRMTAMIEANAQIEESDNLTSATVKKVQESLEEYEDTVSQMNSLYSEQVVPQIDAVMEGMSEALGTVAGLLDSLCDTTDSMKDVFEGVNTTLGALSTSLSQLQDIINNTNSRLKEVLAQLEGASEGEQMEILMTFLKGDPDTLGNYFSEPVHVEEEYIYEIANYGSGVAPFYTTLAIWVGMTILVSLIKVHAEKSGLKDVRPRHLYFGRYLIFFLLSQIQTLIIVLGDLYWLKIQCLHPFMFWLAGAMTSLTFSLFIYSLTIAFGDVGKAVAVVVMVIQIAGSGGTYPIEALPGFFKAVYIFFPFPYAINTMRECIGGIYENSYLVYMLELGIFCFASLVIGLVIRIPFMGINHFLEKRMEDTEMM